MLINDSILRIKYRDFLFIYHRLYRVVNVFIWFRVSFDSDFFLLEKLMANLVEYSSKNTIGQFSMLQLIFI